MKVNYLDNGGDYLTPTGFGQNENGDPVKFDTSNLPLLPRDVYNNLSPEKKGSINIEYQQQQQNKKSMQNQQNQNGAILAADYNGNLAASRLDVPTIAAETRTVTLELDARDAAILSNTMVKVAIGGSPLLLAQIGALGTVPAEFLIGGTYGAQTLNILNEAARDGFEIKEFDETAESREGVALTRAFEVGGALSFFKGILGDVALNVQPYNYAKGLGTNVFSPQYRNIRTAVTVTPTTGMVRTISGGTKTTIVFTISKLATARVFTYSPVS